MVRGEELRFVGFADLTVELLRGLKPTLLVAPLVGDGFDAVDVATRLAVAGFRGRFRVVTPPIPVPAVVRADVEEAAGEIDFDLVILAVRPN